MDVTSMYDQIGGTAAVAATVDGLYRRVLADPLLAPFFDGVEMDRQMQHMRSFLTTALGGARAYEGRDMATAHAGLDINDRHFDRITTHLGATLGELGVPADQVKAILARIAPLRGDVVSC